ncbi:RlmE family RNA methyltransferase [Dichotomicrobium thermohalophilum]|uniref:Ribosomal RNA large subunit methyltransferase E n=1 Tax=Dichotomicrobium thermohalophilum TaxID=933063 RepID=A0A397QA14_9HYPH|nr:RlmE family RNA methyltransferase [Dichotomicrobium thermohalophilum]RIA56635.1 23S rRNA Um-2552 2'-O-methyltransferase [Dichotomicrobium thermohalophilum]
MARKQSGKRGASGRGRRDMTVRVRTARGRKASSTRWLQRQLNDPYVAAARREGYRSRAAYKLIEIDDKHQLLKAGAVVVDLGAAPGGWSQVAAQRVMPGGKVIAIDLLEMNPLPDVTVLQGDFLEDTGLEAVNAALAGQKADVVLSDMAPSSTGHRQTDHLRTVALAEAALDFALRVLAPDGTFLAKVFQGGAERDMLDLLKRSFASVRHVKPKASRAESPETYVLATGFRGTEADKSP